VARDAVATRRGFGSPQATSQKREVANPALGTVSVIGIYQELTGEDNVQRRLPHRLQF
jgi:hypothetical protein